MATLVWPTSEWRSPRFREATYFGTILVWVLIGVILPWLYRFRTPRKNQRHSFTAKKKLVEQLTFPELLKWLGDENPIRSRNQDFFGAEDRAQRIWSALKTRRSTGTRNLMQTVVLEGPFGSGKSSVIALLRDVIEGQRDYLLITVSAWGFSSSAARQHILSQIVQVLSSG